MTSTILLSPVEEITRASYEHIAATRARTHNAPSFWEMEFAQYRALLPLGRILDAGCGSGRDALLFGPAGYEYHGVDASPAMLAIARETINQAMIASTQLADMRVSFNLCDLYHLDPDLYPDSCFDGIWAAASLIHAPKKSVGLQIEELARVTRHNGVGFFAMKEGTGEKLVEKGDDRRFFSFYTQDEFRDLLEKRGYAIVEMGKNFKELAEGRDTVWLTYLAIRS